jgi:HAMP domain-containing protein
MRIRTRFNIALAGVFILGFALSVLVTYRVLLHNAKDEVLRNAGLMMETALAVRSYTIDEIKPHLDPLLDKVFLPQTVPAYSAVETFGRLQKKYPDFSYREATLNPTNPRDRANDWEKGIINEFRSGSATEAIGERQIASGPSLYIARPIKISNPACLACHSTPAAAPASLLAKYGEANGFGWQHNEIIGAQIISIPTGLAERNAMNAFWSFTAVLGSLFVVLFIVINIMLSRLVVTPIRRIAELSDEISKGNLDLPEFEENGAEEIRHLHTAFNRMRRSIEKAIKVVQLQKDLLKKP